MYNSEAIIIWEDDNKLVCVEKRFLSNLRIRMPSVLLIRFANLAGILLLIDWEQSRPTGGYTPRSNPARCVARFLNNVYFWCPEVVCCAACCLIVCCGVLQLTIWKRLENVPGLFPKPFYEVTPAWPYRVCFVEAPSWSGIAHLQLIYQVPLKNLVWNWFKGANTVSQAWYMAAVLYSKYDSNWLLYRFTSSPSVKKRALRTMDAIVQAASVAISTTASLIDKAWLNGTPNNSKKTPLVAA